jgi:hypothetical protein
MPKNEMNDEMRLTSGSSEVVGVGRRSQCGVSVVTALRCIKLFTFIFVDLSLLVALIASHISSRSIL